MNLLSRSQGKYVKVDFQHPEPIGICDYSGFAFNRSQLNKQMEWRGDNLVWTGFMVGTPFLDEPSPQNRPPVVKNDPKPVKNARPVVTVEAPANNQIVQDLNNLVWGR